MSKTEQEALIERIRKLKAKAEDPSVTEAEAALYAAKVAELLQQYNLSEAAIEIDEQKEEVGEQTFGIGSSGVNPWAHQLSSMVAKLYFCSVYLRPVPFKQAINFVFVGKPHNIDVAKSMFEYLVKTINRLANEYANSPAAMVQPGYSFVRARNGFQRGASARMQSRIWVLYKEQAQANKPQRSDKGNPSNLPALYEDEESLIKAYMASLGLRNKRGGGSDTSGAHAAQGYNRAGSISMNGQIGGSSSSKLLK